MALRIIIVDDNPAFLRSSRSLLECQGANVVAVATSAAEGLRLAGTIEADVILVDVDMGDDSGFEVTRALAAGDHVAARVVLISTYPEDDLADLVAASPAVGYIAKSQLSTQSIEAVLDRGSG